MEESFAEPSPLHTVARHRRSETFGWLVMVGLAFLIFELTADSSLAVVLGCLKFGSPELRVARWLRRADPDRVRGCACSWFYVVLAIMRIGSTALLVMIVLIAMSGPGIPQGQLERQLIGALLVIFACFAGAALASWVAVASALRGNVHPWMDATAKSAVKGGFWPPVVPEHCRRAGIGPGLIVVYAVFTGWASLLAVLVIAVGATVGLDASTVLLGILLSTFCAILWLFLTPSALWRIEAKHVLECYPELAMVP